MHRFLILSALVLSTTVIPRLSPGIGHHSLLSDADVVPEQRDQAPHLLIFLRCESILKSAKLPIDSLHRLLCLFGVCGAGRSTSSNIQLVTTFSGERNWSAITIGLLVGMMLVSNCSSRRERLLLIIIVGCHKAASWGHAWCSRCRRDLLGGLLLKGSCHGDCMAKVIPG